MYDHYPQPIHTEQLLMWNQDVLLLPDKKRTDFSWHEIEVSIRIAFHAIKNITSEILSEISLQRKSRQTENSVGDFTISHYI